MPSITIEKDVDQKFVFSLKVFEMNPKFSSGQVQNEGCAFI